jgi:DNA-binding NtrC family response regulator
MQSPSTSITQLAAIFDASLRPIYVVDAARRVVYCNRALAGWLGMEPAKILGRQVEYHSLPATHGLDNRPSSLAPLTELCPPPVALAGSQCFGTVATANREGRLIHRRAEFVPLGPPIAPSDKPKSAAAESASRDGVLVIIAALDLSPEDVAGEIQANAAPDELHAAIRRFRHAQAAVHSPESILGESSGMQKVRTQVFAAAAAPANVLIRGPRGSGRGHVARIIHYQRAATHADAKLVPLDCTAATEDLLRRSLERFGKPSGTRQDTLLIQNLEQLPHELVSPLIATIAGSSWGGRVIATLTTQRESSGDLRSDAEWAIRSPISRLIELISTIAIDMPPLASRSEDLPILAKSFLEICNQGNSKQVGSIHSDALDMMAVYAWPGELDELRSVMIAAHAAATTVEITPADLPVVIHHAAKAAALPSRRPPERIVLDELLASMEREAIERALNQASGNKTAAAELLGMTRPRLYRRLVQLGLVAESTIEFEEDSSP